MKKIDKYKKEVKAIIKDKKKTESFLKNVAKKIKKTSIKEGKEKVEEVKTCSRLIKAYTTKEYREVPRKTLIYIIGALLYFLNPWDLIPDFLLNVGLLDDFTVLGFVYKNFKEDLDNFIKWEASKKIKNNSNKLNERESAE